MLAACRLLHAIIHATDNHMPPTQALAHHCQPLSRPLFSPAVPDWLPPWSDQSARQAKLEEQCPHHRVPTGYANATLCGSNAPSPLLAASMASGLAPTPCAPCVYNPVPADGDEAVTAWRFDQDNQCWMQVLFGRDRGC